MRHDVVARGGAHVLGVGIHGQGPDAIPSGHHVPAAHLEARREVLFALVDEVLDLIFGDLVVEVRLRLDVRGPHQGVALPGEEEEEGAARGHHVHHAHVPGAVVGRQHDVRAARAVDHGLHVLALAELTQAVSERPTGVDNLLRFDREGLCVGFGLVNDNCSTSDTQGVKEDLADSGIVQDACAVHCRSERDREVCAGIVVRTLIEHGNVLHAFAVHLRELLPRAGGAHDVGAGGRPEAQGVVELEEDDEEPGHGAKGRQGVVEWRGPDDPLVQGHRDGHPVGYVGVHGQHVRPLAETPHDHVPSAEELVHGPHRVLQGTQGEKLHQSLHQVSRTRPEQLRGL
mmetsp:Transcript_42681/g.133214  ORF Transcript_42681/g.133214 Transcript_42681/m.133214 type:complete len:343 (+) Transcript_42681:1005-2033(+)